MGRWSQYRHRGRGNPSAAGGFPLDPPDEDQFIMSSTSNRIQLVNFADCVVGADGWDYRFSLVDGGPWTEVDGVPCSGTPTIVDPCTTGVPWFAQVRWTLGGSPVSDWSASLSVTCAI